MLTMLLLGSAATRYPYATHVTVATNLNPQALTRYENIAPAVELSGPTSFAPLIRKAIEIVKGSGQQYHCLVIIADGQV